MSDTPQLIEAGGVFCYNLDKRTRRIFALLDVLRTIIQEDEHALEKKKNACEMVNEILVKGDTTFAEAFNTLLYIRNYGIASAGLFKYVFEKYGLPVTDISIENNQAILTYTGFKLKVPLIMNTHSSYISVIPDMEPSLTKSDITRNGALKHDVSQANEYIFDLKRDYINDERGVFGVLADKEYKLLLDSVLFFIESQNENSNSEALDLPMPKFYTLWFKDTRRSYIEEVISTLEKLVDSLDKTIAANDRILSNESAEYKMAIPKIQEALKAFDNTLICNSWFCSSSSDFETMRLIASMAEKV